VALAAVVVGLAIAPIASAGGYTLALYQRLPGEADFVAWTSGNAPKNATLVNTCGSVTSTVPVTGWTKVEGGFRALVAVDTSASTGQQCTATLAHGGNSVASVSYVAP
jgi:hypothetical protein